MTYYYDNTPYETIEAVKTIYPQRFFYKRRYKDGDKVLILVDCFGRKTMGEVGTICGKRSDFDRGHYTVVLNNHAFKDGKKRGFTVKAKGLFLLKKVRQGNLTESEVDNDT